MHKCNLDEYIHGALHPDGSVNEFYIQVLLIKFWTPVRMKVFLLPTIWAEHFISVCVPVRESVENYLIYCTWCADKKWMQPNIFL